MLLLIFFVRVVIPLYIIIPFVTTIGTHIANTIMVSILTLTIRVFTLYCHNLSF